uniref:Mitogen-activated protein kinase kinase kinase 19 n=1 Tax=Fundulus heteroclitus TaxID=8078 RepID=A0A3Q2SVA9_FUNHE
ARTPKLLVPLDGRPKDCKALPSLKPHAPLKPITRSPLCSRTELRKERLSWGSLCNGRSKAGSEDSGSSSSSSSHCSINLETEDDDNDDDDGQVQETSFKEKGLKLVKDGMLQRSSNASNANQSKEAAESESLKECNYSQKVDPLGVRDFESNKKSDTSVFSEDKRNMNCTTESKTGISNKMTNDVRDLQDDATGWFEEKCENGQIISEQIEPTRKVFCDQETKAKETRAHSAAVEKTGFFPVDPKKYEKMFKARNKESKTRMNCRLKANNSTTHSVTKDPSILGSNRSKTSSKYSGVSTGVKTKSKKSPEYFGKTRDTSLTKVKLSIKSGNAAYFSADTLTLHKACEPQQSNETHKQSPVRELRSAQQFKKQCFGGKSPRSKSAVDLITYRDMFQQIQSGTEGPAMYEMFAGPLFENLRVSSSCEKLKERQPQRMATKKTKPNHKATNKPVQNKAKRNSAESTAALTKSKAKPVSSQTKPQSITNSCRTESGPKPTVEVGTTKEFSHKSSKDEYEDHILSTIMEALSKDGSETFERDDKTLTGPTTPFYGVDSRFMENHVASSGASTDNSANQHPELTPSLNPQQANTNPSTSSGSSCLMSPVYKKFLEEVGEGPLTDDLLQCLAEELISLDERDVSAAPEDSEQGKRESSSCQVYCGLTSQGQLIAVKQVCLDSSDPDAAKKEYNRLQGEVDLLKTLRHSNIVGFLGTSLYQHVVSIFMEYIPGGSIASILHRFGPLPERVLALYTHQILEGVAFLHQNRVIHRDLKGNNVMLMPTGVIKLIDFGCARRLSCLNHTAPNSGELLKSVHGTPYWMAPEVISESGYGRKSDIWSVGCTVFEMATGKPPLAHMDKMAALFYIGARRGLMPTLPDGFSDNAKDFVKICLTSDQSLRPSADQLLRHSFIPKGQTNIKYWEAQRKNCCGP